MSFSFASLGSGSRGNATLIRSNNTLLLVDNGFTIKETERRLAILGHSPDDITAILVTHEHSDHIKGVGPFARKYGLPVYLTHGTAQYDGLNKVAEMHQVNIHRPFAVEDIDITPVAVPHDAREPCQFVFRHGGKTMGLLTDLGSITPHVTEQYQQCDALMLECNHCPQMLAMGPYPPSLKHRVAGHWGHLSNHQAANLLEQIEVERIQHLVISHISEKNNTEALAKSAVTPWYSNDSLILAQQDEAIDWLSVN
ncbi:MBL fold metallo-hydrolase [Oceanicoccus sagamiensis]|uniref:MBL fold metallo-hydrolase n=1 Tax=Oceanicoccus sagamiensis TaxID=716816 RepID=A0A1X9NC36_9GAMM|nr:MBL fold metallo-hydrolase [Oceanicoccus sagamiensis]ARN74731.1 MBL fold metallo-hydrolase [Oceanicoccus sagamiensis]